LKRWILTLALVAALVLVVSPIYTVHAATTAWSGTLGTDTVMSWSDPAGSACLPNNNPDNARSYHVQPFYVNTATTYDLVITAAAGMNIDSDGTMHAVYQSAFNVADWTINCIAYDGSLTDPSSITGLALTPNTQYYVVVMNTYFGPAAGATFSGEIRSTTGTATLGMLPAAPPSSQPATSGPGVAAPSVVKPGVDMVALPEGSAVGTFLFATPLYYAPASGAVTNVVIEAGKSLWVTGLSKDGLFYQVVLSGQFLWVPVEALAPTNSAPWNGVPLPSKTAS